jgi:hypothetical protein
MTRLRTSALSSDAARARGAIVAFLLTVTAAACSTGPDGRAGAAVDVGPCGDGDPNHERWGTSCLCCHRHDFGVAGSIAKGSGVVDILVEDRDGRTAEMSPDIFDNFFRHRKLTPPLVATITFVDGEQRVMRDAPHGSCNGCHGVSASAVGSR